MTGPATNAATITTVWKVMGKRVAVIYLAAVAVSALAAGLVLDAFFRGGIAHSMSHSHWMLPDLVNTISAAALLGVLGYAFIQPAKVGEAPKAAAEGEITHLTIAGMTCNHCAGAVQKALAESRGVTSAEVDLKKGEAVVSGAGFDLAELVKAVESLGYRVTRTGERSVHDRSK
jgi:copper chaperone CopZ